MLEKIVHEAEEKMKKAVEFTRQELAKLRTGKATLALLDDIRIEMVKVKRLIEDEQAAGIQESSPFSVGGAQPEAQVITTGNPWISCVILNDGPNTVLYGINEGATLQPIFKSEHVIIDLRRHGIQKVNLSVAAGSSASGRITGLR